MVCIWQYGEWKMSTDKKKPKWEYQGKTREQVEFSTMMAGMGVLFMILMILFSWMWKIIL